MAAGHCRRDRHTTGRNDTAGHAGPYDTGTCDTGPGPSRQHHLAIAGKPGKSQHSAGEPAAGVAEYRRGSRNLQLPAGDRCRAVRDRESTAGSCRYAMRVLMDPRREVRAHNIVKHVCVAARIGEGKAPGEGNSRSIAKTSNAAIADSGCNPSGWHEFWPMASSKVPCLE